MISDGTAIVNKIKLGSAVENCRQLAEAFLRIVLCEADDAFEIRVRFDRYLESLLTERTREKRGRGLEVVSEVADHTSLKKTHSMRTFLSHINTKQTLKIYFGRCLSMHQPLETKESLFPTF